MKVKIINIIALLSKYNRLWVVNLAMIGVLALCITALVTSVYELAVCSCFLILLCAWEISDVFLFQKHDNALLELANAKDKLVLAEHEAERLILELEVTQAALLNAKSPKIKEANEAKTKEVTAADTGDIQPKPRPKRPSSQRRPKPKQTGNENQN